MKEIRGGSGTQSSIAQHTRTGSTRKRLFPYGESGESHETYLDTGIVVAGHKHDRRYQNGTPDYLFIVIT